MNKISIALCTYNGERYLQAQLNSYLSQSRLPDELIVCDDASTDCTLTILKAFVKQASFCVKIVQNEANLGSTKNFEKAISLCTGDIILLSDQDDVWFTNKVEAFEQAFASNPHSGVVLSDSRLVDEQLRPLGKTMWETIPYAKRFIANIDDSDAIFRLLLNNNFFTGSSMGFRATLCPYFFPVSSYWVHDGWLAIIASTLTNFTLIDAPLNFYRQHETSQIGAGYEPVYKIVYKALQLDKTYFLNDSYAFEDVACHLNELDLSKPALRIMLENKINHCRKRANFPKAKISRLFYIIDELISGNYSNFSCPGGLTALRDLVVP